ncbi:hypothetical protein P8452_05432 [Trifolium repens]|nr:hypothetical protein P8452_05432 [Trifolium repens]
MEKVLPLFLLVSITMMTTFPFNFVSASSSHCRPMINDVFMLCQPYFFDHTYISRSSPCCSIVKSLVAFDSGCICDNQMELNNYPMLNNNATKMIKLPALCGVSLPCDSDSHGLKNLTANSAQSSQSNSSSKPQLHSSPNSPASLKLVVLLNDHLFDFLFFLKEHIFNCLVVMLLLVLVLVCSEE